MSTRPPEGLKQTRLTAERLQRKQTASSSHGPLGFLLLFFYINVEAHSGGNLSLIHESSVNFFSEHFNYSCSCKDHLGSLVPQLVVSVSASLH